MKRHINSLFEFSYSFLLSIVHTLLMLPVLHLFLTINDLSGFYSYSLFFIVAHIIASLFKKWWVYILIQSGAIVFFLYRSFPPFIEEMSFFEWFSVMWQYGIDEWSALFSTNSGSLPVFLTAIALLLLITLLTYIAVHQKLAIPSFLVGLSYLFVLHAFTGHTILRYAISVVGFGLLFIGLVRIDHQSNKVHFFKTTILTTLLTPLLIGVAYWGIERFRPVQDWIETNSAGYQSALEERGFFDWILSQSPRSRFRQIGMDTDDRDLGGPLQNDFTPLFKAYTEEPHYWKVLHRLEYTGNGWVNPSLVSNDSAIVSPYEPEYTDFMYEEISEEATVSQDNVTLDWNDPLTYIAYPYGWERLEVIDAPVDFVMIANNLDGHYNVPDNQQDVSNYRVDYNAAFPGRLDEELLKQDDGWREEYINTLDSAEVDSELSMVDKMNQTSPVLVQLPSSLPQRVRDLAAELTEGLDSEYEMVRAIESYLKSEGNYRYSLRDAELTPDGEDYVDHFLFETLVGYCDNFSSAMTVMLRSVGIPARWTKGFSQGTEHTDIDGSTYYQITNANAHSWVEVYFPSTGWVPFDSSPSFSNPMTRTEADLAAENSGSSFNENDMPEEGSPEAEDPEVQTPEETPDEETPEETERGSEEEIIEESSENNSVTSSEESLNSWYLLFLIPIFFILLFTFYFFSVHLKVAIWILEKLIQKNKLSLLQASRWTLRLFQIKKKKLSNQTFENYFEGLDLSVNEYSDVLNLFAHLLNQVFYGHETAKDSLSAEQKIILLDSLQVLKFLPKYKN